MLHSKSVHWLSHTGISDDVKLRPREYVRDDVGRRSNEITDKCILMLFLENKVRSAKAKKIVRNT